MKFSERWTAVLSACALLCCSSGMAIHAEDQIARHDVNNDGEFDVADIVTLQRWILQDGTILTIPEAADLNADGTVDVYDLGLMKRELMAPDAPYVFKLSDVPAYTGEAWYVIDDNTPDFSDLVTVYGDAVFEYYSPLDELGRCGMTCANICQELMPEDKRDDISSVKPSGWMYEKKSNNNKYDFITGKYVYNRCHLIGYQLAGENANPCNLITGTRYLNIEGMLPFENQIANYIQTQNKQPDTDVHVLYRVTPYYEGDNLVADGVRMEGWSVEDAGMSICFDVFCYNVQPGVVIDYATGQNQAAEAS